MAKSSTRVTFELPPASHAILEQAARDNGINLPAAASLILQAALVRRVSSLVPKRPQARSPDRAAGRRLRPRPLLLQILAAPRLRTERRRGGSLKTLGRSSLAAPGHTGGHLATRAVMSPVLPAPAPLPARLLCFLPL